MRKPELVVFDIDGTLTRSKQLLETEMAKLLSELLESYKVALISGANFKQFKWQVLDQLTSSPERLENLYLLPATGTGFCRFEDTWQCHYDEEFSLDEKDRINKAFENIFKESGLEKPEMNYGVVVEDRGAQLNFSAFGQDAPIELKEKWDPDGEKRTKMIEVLHRSLPDFSIHFGGTTSIEVSREGIDKAYGLKKLMKETDISKEKILFIGDKLEKGGNDAPVLTLGIESLEVSNPEETKVLISKILAL